ncbi:MAG: FtsL-like putative cell division protein [Tepidiformaceae bacterium]|tara:strand:- start:2346 stop:2762 length:417 start_codon:yes stop_codon:yes gene_type:complete
MATRQQALARFPQSTLTLRWGLIVSIALLALSALIPVLQASLITTQGHDLQLLKQNRTRLTSEIRLLESELAGLNSLERIERRAREIGLTEPDAPPIFIQISSNLTSVTKTSEGLPGQERSDSNPTLWWRSILIEDQH